MRRSQVALALLLSCTAILLTGCVAYPYVSAGERALEMSVAETASGDGTLARMITIGRELKDLDGAAAIVMGCAGMARHRKPLEDALGIPVIDPTQAAVTMAIGTIAVG